MSTVEQEVSELEALLNATVPCEAKHIFRVMVGPDKGQVRPMSKPCSEEAHYVYTSCKARLLVCVAFAVETTNSWESNSTCATCLAPVHECRTFRLI